MVVKKEVRNGWKIMYEHGDIEQIVESSVSEILPKGISRTTISHALRVGRMNETTFEAINKFYKEKKKRQDQKQARAVIAYDND